MLSRVADSVYWMSRYLERAENVARFINVNLSMLLDAGGAGDGPHLEQWMPLVETTGDDELYKERYGEVTRDNVLQFLTFDPLNANSILSCVIGARENARSVRETIGSEMWEQVNKFYLFLRDAASAPDALEAIHEVYDSIISANHLLRGLTDSTMSHNEAWHFARLGQMLERADKTSRILDVKYFYLLPKTSDVGSPLDLVQWSALLRSASALEFYRKRHHLIDPVRVAEFLILDREFPRAVRFCLGKAEDSLFAITGTPADRFTNPAEQRLGRLRAEFDYMTGTDLFRVGLHEFLDDFQARLNEIGSAVFETFFALPPITVLPRATPSMMMAEAQQ